MVRRYYPFFYRDYTTIDLTKRPFVLRGWTPAIGGLNDNMQEVSYSYMDGRYVFYYSRLPLMNDTFSLDVILRNESDRSRYQQLQDWGIAIAKYWARKDNFPCYLGIYSDANQLHNFYSLVYSLEIIPTSDASEIIYRDGKGVIQTITLNVRHLFWSDNMEANSIGLWEGI